MVVSKQSLNQNLNSSLKEIFDPGQLESCLQKLQIVEPNPGELCWNSQTSENGVYLIIEGKARLLDNNDNLIVSLSEGWFGQITLFPEINLLDYAVRASLGLQVGYLDRSSWESLMIENQQLKAVFYRQAIELDLLLRYQQNNNIVNTAGAFNKDILLLLPFLRQHYLAQDSLPQFLLQSEKLWLLRQGEILHSSGRKLTPGNLYEIEKLPQSGEWLVSQPTELYSLDRDLQQLKSEKSVTVNNSTSLTKLDQIDQISFPRKAKEESEIKNGKTQQSLLYFPSPRVKVSQWWQQRLRRYPFFKQHSNSDCGVACLVMVGKYWGKTFSVNQLRHIANVDRAGTSIKGLIRAAEFLGFMVRPRKADLPALASQELPAIAHWEGNHYVVVYQVTKKQVMISDPQVSRRILTREEFVAGWTGYIVLLTPTAKFKQAEEAQQDLWKYTTLLKPYWFVLIEVFVTSLMIQIVGLFSPIFTQVLLDRVVVQRSVSTLVAVGAGLIIFSLFNIALSSLRRYLLYHTANKIDLSLIVGFISHTFQLPLSYFETRYVGDITSRISENRKIRSFITGDAITTVLDIFSIFVYLILMFWYSWQLSLLALTIIPIFAITTFVATPFLLKVSREKFNADTSERSYLIEALTGVGTIKSMGVERTVRWRWEDLISEAVRISFSGQMISERIQVVTEVLETMVSSTLLLFGVWQVIQNQLTIGQLIAFNMLVVNLIKPFKRLIKLWNDFQEIRIAIERTDDVINTKPEEDLSSSSSVVLPPVRGHICFEDVTFRYNLESDINTIENLTFTVRPGQTVALVGRSGSGKTTIAKLLLGLYSPTKGKILIDGYDINNLSLHSLREQAGVVDQDTFLFGGTIQENLTIGHPRASRTAIDEACRLAGAAEFIEEMPLRYNTQIGEGGGLLSGGQRQRLAIARALLGKPRLLILDEATSNLDAESERIIQNNLETILKNQTTFVIAHRLSTVRNAELILVMDRGILVESGTHQELMKQKGQYYYLNQQQLAISN